VIRRGSFGGTASRRFTSAVLLGVIALSCRKEEQRVRKATSAASSPTTANIVAARSAPVPSVQAPEEAALVVVRTWSDALDRHDLTKLETLYADEVRFYGRSLTKAAVLESKAAALRKQTTFRQQIMGPITSGSSDGGILTATFTKRSGEEGKLTETSAKLVLRWEAARTWQIVEEADLGGDPGTELGGCQERVAEVVNSLPAVKRAIAEGQAAADESGGRATFGGIGPTEDDDGGFSARIGLHTQESFEALVSYSVDGKGRLTVNAGGVDLELPAATLRSVERACRR
jgi:hypothetical protein